VFGFSQLGAKANLFGSKFSSGTSIATINISGKTEDEVHKLLETEASEWGDTSVISLQMNDITVPIQTSLFQFNFKETLENVIDSQENRMVVSFDQNTLLNEISSMDSTVIYEEINTDQLVSDIITIASLLKTGDNVLTIEDYLGATTQNKQDILGNSIITPKNTPADLVSAINKLKTIEVEGQTTFSFLEYLESQGLQTTISSPSKNIIASGIYQAILPTNFVIIEKNTSRELPENIPMGFEAKIDVKKNIDFVFNNPNKEKYSLHLKWESNGLHVTVSGNTFTSSYKIKMDEMQYFSPKTIKQFSPLLKTGEKKVEVAGEKGVLIKVFREEYKNNKLVQKGLISEDFYPPKHQIEIHSLAQKATSGDPQTPNQESEQSDEENQGENSNPDPASDSDSTPDDDSNTDKSDDKKESDLFGSPNETPK